MRGCVWVCGACMYVSTHSSFLTLNLPMQLPYSILKPGEFNVETKHAGIGTLLIRVHGLKDAFKIEASPVSDKDPRTLIAHYSPKIPGEYTIFVRWSGVHVPGSPFTVNISRRQGKHSSYHL